MSLQNTFTLRFGLEHSQALDMLAYVYRRSRADTLRLLVEREAVRIVSDPEFKTVDPLTMGRAESGEDKR